METLDAVIVGGGQAGLSLSYFLSAHGISHVILERDRAFSVWHGRWDTFRMNTANWMNVLPGHRREFVPGKDPDRTASRLEALSYFNDYLESTKPPLREQTQVLQVQQESDVSWLITTTDGKYRTPNVVICTGQDSDPKFPEVASHIPHEIPTLHSSEYRNPAQIETRNVLVVGSGSSGVQICEDMARSDRFAAVYLSVSGNLVIPWEILGVPVGTIVRRLNVFNVQCESWTGRRICDSKDKGFPAMAPSPAWLKKTYGIRLVGKVTNIQADRIACSDGNTVPLVSLSIIWCTGFASRYEFLHVRKRNRVFNNKGKPIHLRGVIPAAPGLDFVGLKWQHTVSSHLLYGVGRDADYIAQHIRIRQRNL